MCDSKVEASRCVLQAMRHYCHDQLHLHTDLLIHEGCLDAIKGHILWLEVAEGLKEQLPLFWETIGRTLHCFKIFPGKHKMLSSSHTY